MANSDWGLSDYLVPQSVEAAVAEEDQNLDRYPKAESPSTRDKKRITNGEIC